jgi:peptidylprolyl isomerase
MQATQAGDRVLVHYEKRFADGSVVSSRSKGEPPLALTVGAAHPRLPGLGDGLLGLIVGSNVTLAVPAERAYGLPDPSRVRKVARDRFPADEALVVGRRVRLANRGGGSRSVRVVSVRNRTVVVDANHPWAGQGVELRVELVAILDAGEGPLPSSS